MALIALDTRPGSARPSRCPRPLLEGAGLTIVSEKESENRMLQCEDDARRELELWRIAGEDRYEWARNKERLARAHVDHHGTPEWRRTLDFIEQRPHLSLRMLCRILEARGFKTLTGKARWTAPQAQRARAELAERCNRAATLQRYT